MQTIWGIHLEWDDGATPPDAKDIAIGWRALGDLITLPATREGFKAQYVKAYPQTKPGAIPVKAGVPFRFCRDMKKGDAVAYPSRADKMINLGVIASDYLYEPGAHQEYPHRRRVSWKAHLPRAQFSQAALYEIGSAITLFQILNNAEEFLAALNGAPLKAEEVDADDTTDNAAQDQAEDSVEDFVVKRLKHALTPKLFEEMVAELLRAMGYFARVTQYSGDGGVDVIAHRDELGFEPPLIKVQCKQVLTTTGGPTVQRLLGAIQPNEHALFVTLGDYSKDALSIERGKSNLRLIGRSELVQFILNNYEKLDPRFKSLVPLKRSYAPSVISAQP